MGIKNRRPAGPLARWGVSIRAATRVVGSYLCLICCLVALVPTQAIAQYSSDPSGDVTVVGRPSIQLMVGEGRLLRFDGPVDSVFIADSTIADVRVVSPDVVYVYGKKSGMTNLIAIAADQKVRATVQFRVATNPQPANDARRKLQPTSTTEVSIFGDRAAVTGRTRRSRRRSMPRMSARSIRRLGSRRSTTRRSRARSRSTSGCASPRCRATSCRR